MTRSHLLFAFCASLFACTAAAQPQWRFHLAFEDGTGARDTIWFVYDTTATTGSDFNPLVDEHLGEGAVEMDLDVFNVFVWNWQWDSTKTKALPYSSFPYGHVVIEAFNYTAPVIIRWDTALFNSPVLPITSTAFFGVARLLSYYFLWAELEDPLVGGFNMFNVDSVVVTLPDLLFAAFYMNFNQSSGVGIMERVASGSLHIHPNPSEGQVNLSSTEPFYRIDIRDAHGRTVHSERPNGVVFQLDLHHLPAGIYFIRAYTSSTVHHAQLIKVHR